MKKIIFYSYTQKLHSLYNSFLDNPPKGFQFIGEKESTLLNIESKVKKQSILSSILQIILKFVDPTSIKDFLYKYKKFESHDLLYSTGHLCYRNEPWVLDAEMVSIITGYNIKKLEKKKNKILKLLLSNNCKAIFCWTEKSKKSFELFFNNENINKKIEVLYPTKDINHNFVKQYNNDKVRLLYIGSANYPGIFDAKGGRETLLAYKKLSKIYGDKIELFIASEVPEKYNDLIDGVSNLIIDSKIRMNTGLDKVFEKSDIFIQPAHYTMAMAPIDAMSYELPIISTNVGAISEYVIDGYNGFLVEGSKYIEYNNKYAIPNYQDSFNEGLKEIDNDMIISILEKTSLLIDNKELRKKMGINGRKEFEEGKFSLKEKNKRLEKILNII